MGRIAPAFLFLLASGLLLPDGLAAPRPQERQPQLKPLARFCFNGNGKDSTGNNPDFELRNTSFKDNALSLNGVYQFNGGDTGYRAVCKTKKLDYSWFTVALRFKAADFSGEQRNLITGGTGYRWFGLNCAGGNLTVTLNNQRLKHEFKGAAIEQGKWTVVACSFDLQGRKVVAFLNGKKAGDFDLPRDFKLAVATSEAKETDKEWTFTNYSNGWTFNGLVDELILYGKALSPKEMASIPLRP